jgi:hypothetical protein
MFVGPTPASKCDQADTVDPVPTATTLLGEGEMASDGTHPSPSREGGDTRWSGRLRQALPRSLVLQRTLLMATAFALLSGTPIYAYRAGTSKNEARPRDYPVHTEAAAPQAEPATAEPHVLTAAARVPVGADETDVNVLLSKRPEPARIDLPPARAMSHGSPRAPTASSASASADPASTPPPVAAPLTIDRRW